MIKRSTSANDHHEVVHSLQACFFLCKHLKDALKALTFGKPCEELHKLARLAGISLDGDDYCALLRYLIHIYLVLFLLFLPFRKYGWTFALIHTARERFEHLRGHNHGVTF